MEKRVVVAIVLCGVVLLVHFLLVAPHQTPPPVTDPVDDVAEGDGEPDSSQAPDDVPEPVEPDKPVVAEPDEIPVLEAIKSGTSIELRTDLVLENELLTTEWTNDATGCCTRVRFRKDFYANTKGDPLDILGTYDKVVTREGSRTPRVLDVNLVEPQMDLSQIRFAVTDARRDRLVFTGNIVNESGKLLKVTKTVWMPADRFEVKIQLSFTNISGVPVTFRYDLGAAEAMEIEDPRQPLINVRSARLGPKGPAAFKTQHYKKFEKTPGWVDPDLEENIKTPTILWAGLENKYFAMLLLGPLPEEGVPAELMQCATAQAIQMPLPDVEKPLLGASVRVQSPPIELPAGGTFETQEFTLFAGPKRNDITDQYQAYGFAYLHYSGWFAPITKVLMFLLYNIHDKMIANYGVAIVLLTVIIRICLHPLTKKGQVSMHKMQKLQPKIKELQAKYKGDKQKLGAEQMKMMREAGANPLSGCLPMLVQIPILIGLWRGLNTAFELRHAPFMLWIQDLSKPETLVTIGDFPIHVLPLLMAVSMFIQQRMTPKSPDPQTQQQMKMMMIMPFVFAFMFYSFPSGLCLYWFVSTLVGMLDQYFIKRHLKEQESLADAAAS